MASITKQGLVNFSVLMYFIFMILTNQLENYGVFIGFYTSLVLCGLAGLYTKDFQVNMKRLNIVLLLIITAFVNTLIVGNTRINDVIFIGLYSFASLSLISEELDEKIPLIGFMCNAIVILYKFATVGVVSGQIFNSSSRNYVSVFLMYPLVIYYSIIGRKAKNISTIPVVIAWVICLFARGRGGIISSTLFILGVYFVKYKNMKSARRIIVTSVIAVGVAVAMLNISSIIQMLGASAIMEMFARNGLGSSRTRFWPEYINLAMGSLKHFIFGADISNTFIGMHLSGNPHNSFIEMHMLNGIIGFGAIVILIIKNVIKSVKNKQYLFLVCMSSMLIRAFTDHVLWAAFGTPVLFFFMFYYDVIPNHNSDNLEQNKP